MPHSSSLRTVLSRLGSVRDVARSPSGARASLVLRRSDGEPRTIDAIRALAFCGASLTEAKRTVEAVLDDGEAEITLPKVPDAPALADRLAAAGFAARIASPPCTAPEDGTDRLG